jgi:hypothetical protein
MKKSKENSTKRRKYLGVLFEECNIYTRIYINKEGTAYVGFCPRCSRKVVIKVGKDGVDNRFFKSNII